MISRRDSVRMISKGNGRDERWDRASRKWMRGFPMWRVRQRFDSAHFRAFSKVARSVARTLFQ